MKRKSLNSLNNIKYHGRTTRKNKRSKNSMSDK